MLFSLAKNVAGLLFKLQNKLIYKNDLILASVSYSFALAALGKGIDVVMDFGV